MKPSLLMLFLALGGLLCSCKKEKTAAAPIVEFSSAPSKISPDLIDEFSGKKAYQHIEALEEFGPRPPESTGYAKSLQYLEKTLKDFGWTTTRQSFRGITPVGPVKFTNLLARYGESTDWNQSVPFIIGSHLDTKRYSNIRFMGSNDSGSSTGVLVEMARVFATDPSAARQIELVFFDGEEAMLRDIDPRRDGLYGSKYYAAELTRRKNKPQAGFVLDLVGDLKVPLHVGLDSTERLKTLAGKAVAQLGLEKYVKSARHPCLDDHIPLLQRAQLPTLHLIGDFAAMPYWHTKNDTLKNVSPKALANSAKLTLKVISLLTE